MNQLMFRVAAVLAFLIAGFCAGAQEYDKVLVPLPLFDSPGAFGSVWRTRVVVSNLSDTPVDVQGYGSCQVECTPPPIPPQGTVNVSGMVRSEVPAGFLFVEKGRRDDLGITIRVFDKSREHLTWGATVPVVTRGELFGGTFGIGDVPVSEDFRSMLRIYDFDASTAGAVRVRIYKTPATGPATPTSALPDELLAELTPAFTIPVQGGGAEAHPGYAAVPLWLMPELAGAELVRVEIEPLDGTADYGGFVSTTHNETQHVTVIAPR
jgi:hypothetical protein